MVRNLHGTPQAPIYTLLRRIYSILGIRPRHTGLPGQAFCTACWDHCSYRCWILTRGRPRSAVNVLKARFESDFNARLWSDIYWRCVVLHILDLVLHRQERHFVSEGLRFRFMHKLVSPKEELQVHSSDVQQQRRALIPRVGLLGVWFVFWGSKCYIFSTLFIFGVTCHQS